MLQRKHSIYLIRLLLIGALCFLTVVTAAAQEPEINIIEGTKSIPNGGAYYIPDAVVGVNTFITFTIENTGEADLILDGDPFVDIIGTNVNLFAITLDPTSLILPGESTTFTVRFTPDSLGVKTATLVIANNDLDKNPYEVHLYWMGWGCCRPINIMPLGDSITRGASSIITDPDYQVGYRQELYLDLRSQGYNVEFVGSLNNGELAEPAFDYNHEGHGAMRDDEMAAAVYGYLVANPADVVLLHIGTNSVDPSPTDVENILDEIDRYEGDSGVNVLVILARIINRSIYSQDTTDFNINIAAMANARIAEGDKIIIVDMENALEYPADMDDDGIHPAPSGYNKMADVWRAALEEALPVCDDFPVITTQPQDQTIFVGETATLTVEATGTGTLSYKWYEWTGTVWTHVGDDSDTYETSPLTETTSYWVKIIDDCGSTSSDYVTVTVEALPTYTISGIVTEGGVGLQGVVMIGLPGEPTTNASGGYSATVDHGWSGTVTPTLAGYSFDPDSRTYSNVTTDQLGQNYAATLETYTISGTVTDGSDPIQGVTITFSHDGHTESTAANGTYSYSVPYGTTTTITPSHAAYSGWTPPNRTLNNITADQPGQNFVGTINQYTISGTVTEGGAGLQGVVMNGLTGNPETNASGNYSAQVDHGWSGTVTPAKAGYTFDPVSRSYSNVTSNQTNQNYTATLGAFTISGTVTDGSDPIQGVTITFSHDGHTESTAANGTYSYSVPYGTTTTITPSHAAYSGWTPPNRTLTNITADQPGQNFTGTINQYTISGTVTEGGVGLQGVVMNGLPGNPETNASGNYSAQVDHGWSGTVTPAKAGYTFDPISRPYSNVTSNQTNQNYTATLGAFTIYGTVTDGANPIQGVTITFSHDGHTESTAANGTYSYSVPYGTTTTITPSHAAYSGWTPPNRTLTNITADQPGQNFTGTINQYTISGRVTEDGVGLQGVVMNGLPGNPETNASGNYSAQVDHGWSGTVTPNLAGYSFDPASRTYSNVTSDQSNQNYTGIFKEFLTDKDAVTVSEGGTGSFQVKLSFQPSSDLTATVARVSGDSDITVSSGGTLNFNPANWDTYQIVTLAAAEDGDTTNGTATIRISATGVENKDITATEQDDDVLNGNISLTLNPATGTSGNNIEISVEVSDNNNSISAYGFEFVYDETFFQFNGVEAGTLTSDWVINVYDISSGRKKIEGVGGTSIPSSSSGSLAKIRLQVLCLDYTTQTQSQVLIENYTDDLYDEFSPEPASTNFNFTPCGILGDVNASGSVTPGDAQSAFEIFLGIITPDFCQDSTSDANCNEFTTPGDAQDIFEHFLGIVTLPECCAEYTASSMLKFYDAIGPIEDDNKDNNRNRDRGRDRDKNRDRFTSQKRKLYPLHTMGYPGEIVRIPIIITNPEGITSFAFEMNYPSQLIEFMGMDRTRLTQDFEYIAGIQLSDGLIRVEGESEVPIQMRNIGSLVVLKFRVTEGPEMSMPLLIFDCEGDLFDVELSEGNFHRLNIFSEEPRYINLGRAARMPDGTVRIPVRVSSAFNVKSFGFKLEYEADKMTFIGVEKGTLTEDFMAVQGNEIEFGKVMIGAYSLSGIQEKRQGTLLELIFSIEQEGGEVKVVKTFDDIDCFIIRRGKIRVE